MTTFWHVLAYLTSLLLAASLGFILGYLACAVLNCEAWRNTNVADTRACTPYKSDTYSIVTEEGYPATDSSGLSGYAWDTWSQSEPARPPITRLSRH